HTAKRFSCSVTARAEALKTHTEITTSVRLFDMWTGSHSLHASLVIKLPMVAPSGSHSLLAALSHATLYSMGAEPRRLRRAMTGKDGQCAGHHRRAGVRSFGSLGSSACGPQRHPLTQSAAEPPLCVRRRPLTA